jgi:cytochrome P450 / NADPH-cytochrome P450 reductase
VKTEPSPRPAEPAAAAAHGALEPLPHPPLKPFLGNILDLSSTSPVQDLMVLARDIGPIFQLHMMGTPITIAWGYPLVDELCDESRFEKSVRGAVAKAREFAGDGLFTAYTSEPNWSKAHNILLPNFGNRAMVGYHPMMLDIAEQMVLKWQRSNSDDEIDVTRDMTALTLDTIALCGFGYRFNSFYRDDYHPFVVAMMDALEIAMTTRGLPFEDLFNKAKQRKLEADSQYMNTVVDRIIEERRAERDAGPDGEGGDLLDHMLTGVDKRSGQRLDDLNIRNQIITFLIAGHETTSGLLSFTMYYLLNHPEVLTRAQDEVDRVFGTDPSVKPTHRQVNQLAYVRQVLKETLRLWPTAPAFALRPYKDEVVGGKYLLKGRSHIMLLLPMLHRDKTVWGERADIFDPDNFTPEAEASRPRNAYKPFGNGQRACIGQQFAMQEATLVIGMVLQRFKLVDHLRYTLRVKESLTIKPEGLRIKVRPRVHKHIVVPQAEQPHAEAAPASSNGAQAATASDRPKHGTPLLVLFGSNLGTSEDIARHVAETGSAQGFDVTLSWLDDYVGKLPTSGAVVIVTASYNGTPPDNAAAFYKWLHDGLPPGALAGVKYTVFGAGNRNWASTYQSIPRQIDERLTQYGAERIYRRGEGDARDDLDAHFESWRLPLWESVAKALDVEYQEDAAVVERPMYALEFVAGPQPNPLAQAHGATTLRILANRELQTKDARSTRHIEVALAPGAIYRPGDHLGVIASNSEALVERVMRRFGYEPGTYVRLFTSGPQRIASLPLDVTLSVRRLLMHYVELQQVATRKQIATMAEHTPCPNSKPQLRKLAADDDDSSAYKNEVKLKRKSVLDLLEQFPACELPFTTYLEMLPLMTPRYYSISSSPLASPDRCSVTVGVVRGPAVSGSGTYEGVCSTYLVGRDRGSRINAFVKDSKSGFRLPDDPSRPIVMIGPGTGLAPFRGFLQERHALKARGQRLGPAMLFYGCRHPEEDYIYRDELEACAGEGLVDLHVAFSRLDGRRTYVQDLIAERADDVWRLIDSGATVYVCGDGSKMEPQVREKLVELYRARTGADPQAGETWLAGLIDEGRYVLDVWASK